MNLYEWEGKKIFEKYGITIPKGVVVRRGENAEAAYESLGVKEVAVKAQILSGKRGKNNGIKFASSKEEAKKITEEMFGINILGQYVAAVLIEERLQIVSEQYISITYDTNIKQPVMIFSAVGGIDIEDVTPEKIKKIPLDIRSEQVTENFIFAEPLWKCFLSEDARLMEINPLILTSEGKYVAADAKVALDEDAFFRHDAWQKFEPRTMMGRLPTEREIAVTKIDEGANYYRGTAGKYIEMDGDVAILFSGGGASISNMDALIQAGCKPANYTEYSGNPPREKVYNLVKIVLSKPGLRGLWIAGGVANFTNIAETFQGIVDALDELKPKYPIVVRRAGPFDSEGKKIMEDCAARNNLKLKYFDKDTPMSATAVVLAEMIGK
ncbi:MAG: ATP-grasp domain-containing protein [Patescibacteria group bacterium]|jgi:citryl-CoA synthetase large subunit